VIRAAALASGEGEKLQAVLDAMYFGELPQLELTAVIAPEKNANVAQRALRAKVPAYVVDPDLFPTMTSHSMAVANKLKDMDVDLVLLCDYELPLGVIPYQFRNKMIGTWPTLCPAFEDCEGDVFEAVLAYGCKVAGATSFIADADGRVGKIIDQRAVPVLPDDTAETLKRRVMEEAEWPLMAEAVKLYCAGKLK
jgi:phosphoribosylglycinamide formyltransferase-1